MRLKLYPFSLILVLAIAMQLFPCKAFAQEENVKAPFKSYLYLQPNIGISQYFGDLNQKDYWNQYPRFAFGAAFGYQLCPVFGIRTEIDRLNIYSKRLDQDKLLTSSIWDAAFHVTININEIFSEYNSKRLLNFYLFSGADLTSFKSKIESIPTGATLNEHSSWQHAFSLPVGAGASVRVSNAVSINLEYTDHTVFNATKIDFTDGGNENNDHYSYASAGVQINFGVKDTDGDGVRDKDDLCPETFGKIELAGCPDKDNDGITDAEDACPDVAGKAEFKGCPDTDGDGVIDSQDLCPNEAGSKALNGCPDRDNDGIADKDDKCPDVAGLANMEGCPDRDGDGIADKDDACPDIKGLAQFNGCPDTDGDGIADNLDKCPDVAGIAANSGCPETKFEYFKVVYFSFDQAVLVTKFVKDLDEVVTVMNEHPNLKLSIEGFADSQGPEAYNLKLSEKRADYVIYYLSKKGIAKDRLVKAYFGEKNPVDTNKTKKGRANNRRVEMKSVK